MTVRHLKQAPARLQARSLPFTSPWLRSTPGPSHCRMTCSHGPALPSRPQASGRSTYKCGPAPPAASSASVACKLQRTLVLTQPAASAGSRCKRQRTAVGGAFLEACCELLRLHRPAAPHRTRRRPPRPRRAQVCSRRRQAPVSLPPARRHGQLPSRFLGYVACQIRFQCPRVQLGGAGLGRQQPVGRVARQSCFGRGPWANWVWRG
jgi:hypothetical protein